MSGERYRLTWASCLLLVSISEAYLSNQASLYFLLLVSISEASLSNQASSSQGTSETLQPSVAETEVNSTAQDVPTSGFVYQLFSNNVWS